MESESDGEVGVFHSLVIVSFAARRSCNITTLILGGYAWMFRCRMANSGLDRMLWSQISDRIEKILYQNEHIDLHDHSVLKGVPVSPQFRQQRAEWEG